MMNDEINICCFNFNPQHKYLVHKNKKTGILTDPGFFCLYRISLL